MTIELNIFNINKQLNDLGEVFTPVNFINILEEELKSNKQSLYHSLKEKEKRLKILSQEK